MIGLFGLAPDAATLKMAVLLLAIILGVGLSLLGAAHDARARRRARLARRRVPPRRGTTG